LLENVVAHTPEGSPLRVRVVALPDGAVVEVADEGPGIAPEALARGSSDRGSTGLGLDIARRCAEASGGSLSVADADPHGAIVTLRLGSAYTQGGLTSP
ncbi:MAG: ATP-binding protein, partial [Jatrophihabitans sp.]